MDGSSSRSPRIDPRKIRARRLELGISVTQAAAACGLSENGYKRLEREIDPNPKFSHLYALLELFHYGTDFTPLLSEGE